MPQLIEAIPIWAIHCIISLAWQYNCVDCCSGWFGSRRKSSPLNSIRSKGVEENAGAVAAVADAVKTPHAVAVAGDGLTVDDAGARAQPSQGVNNQREAVCEVVAWAAVEPHAIAILASDDAEAVMLDLVQP